MSIICVQLILSVIIWHTEDQRLSVGPPIQEIRLTANYWLQRWRCVNGCCLCRALMTGKALLSVCGHAQWVSNGNATLLYEFQRARVCSPRWRLLFNHECSVPIGILSGATSNEFLLYTLSLPWTRNWIIVRKSASERDWWISTAYFFVFFNIYYAYLCIYA